MRTFIYTDHDIFRWKAISMHFLWPPIPDLLQQTRPREKVSGPPCARPVAARWRRSRPCSGHSPATSRCAATASSNCRAECCLQIIYNCLVAILLLPVYYPRAPEVSAFVVEHLAFEAVSTFSNVQTSYFVNKKSWYLVRQLSHAMPMLQLLSAATQNNIAPATITK